MNFCRLLPCFCLCTSLNASATVHYVDLNNSSPTPPYSTWATAATTIQDAVDAANAGDLVLVTNGVYGSGLTLVGGVAISNRVAVTKPIQLASVNGPEFTAIVGYRNDINLPAEVRCVFLTNGATLSGFTLTNGFARSALEFDRGGGGVMTAETNTLYRLMVTSTNAVITNCLVKGCGLGLSGGTVINSTITGCVVGGARDAVLSNCMIRLNSRYGDSYGGGAYACTLYDCRILNNYHGGYGGGGAAYSTLFGCIVANNYASSGGGAYNSTLINCLLTGNTGGAVNGGAVTNCTVVGNITGSGGGVRYAVCVNSIIYGNVAAANPNYVGGTFDYCCTTPLPASGVGNIDTPPGIADEIGGDFRLTAGSACINAGLNAYAASATDLDGNPRIAGGTEDIGAYEFQNVQPVLSIAPSSASVVLRWPAWAGDFRLQETDANSAMASSWSNSTVKPVPNNDEYTATLPADAPTKVFRLTRP